MNKERNKRIFYIDFTRGLADLFMVMQHAMIIHVVSSEEDKSLLENFFILLGTGLVIGFPLFNNMIFLIIDIYNYFIKHYFYRSVNLVFILLNPKFQILKL